MSVASAVNMYDRIFIGLPTKAQALAQRAQHGGRVFVSSDGTLFIWFSFQFTPGEIINHPAHQGLSGTIE